MSRGAQIRGCQFAAAPTFRRVEPNISWPSEWNLLDVSHPTDPLNS